jgi:cyclophilin family peptidyl-prolyl cis-trans isomerase
LHIYVVLTCVKQAPKAVENFRCLCTGERGKGKKSGKPLHYQGTLFHRIVKGFVCQGGDVVKGDGSGGDSIYGGSFKQEKAALKLKHDAAGVRIRSYREGDAANTIHMWSQPFDGCPGLCPHQQVVSMASSNESQFFITLASAPQCDGKHVVLGRVVEGHDVLGRIGGAAIMTQLSLLVAGDDIVVRPMTCSAE